MVMCSHENRSGCFRISSGFCKQTGLNQKSISPVYSEAKKPIGLSALTILVRLNEVSVLMSSLVDKCGVA